MQKTFLFFMACCCLWMNHLSAQSKGILPLTGIRFVHEGIWSKSIVVRMNGQPLFGNRIPLNQQLELNLMLPTGFTVNKTKMAFVGAEVQVVSAKGDVLWKEENQLMAKAATGFSQKDLKLLILKFSVAEGLVQPNSKCSIRFRIYDLKGKNQLRLEYPVTIAYPREKVYTSGSSQQLNAPAGTLVSLSDMKAKKITVSVDTMISTNPNMAYVKIDLTGIDGSSIFDMFQGKESFTVYDSAFNEVKIKDILLKKVGGTLEGNAVNCLLMIPFKLKTDRAMRYFVRYRWDSGDKSRAFDIIVTK